jgi:hypothetical protein
VAISLQLIAQEAVVARRSAGNEQDLGARFDNVHLSATTIVVAILVVLGGSDARLEF